jgi:cell division protein FtsB
VKKSVANPSITPAIPLRERVVALAYKNRRRLATGSAMAVAAVLGYFAVAGDNGITVYKQKRAEDKRLAAQIETLKQENATLQAHVERLQTDPNAIEHVARETLHYTKAGEVIVTLDAPKQSAQSGAPAPSK